MNDLCQQALNALPNGLPIKRAMLARHIPDLTTLAYQVQVSPEVVFRFLHGVEDTQTIQIGLFLGLTPALAVPVTRQPRLEDWLRSQHSH